MYVTHWQTTTSHTISRLVVINTKQPHSLSLGTYHLINPLDLRSCKYAGKLNNPPTFIGRHHRLTPSCALQRSSARFYSSEDAPYEILYAQIKTRRSYSMN
ncbi:hypothetical protein RSOLAG1IB_10865 [Rhizoctonia solani AG-1 IB]|uniref:Uncharacterized protein n=1 Tax=Thanatephorus cucumeris (strain AG1-IB / isolate 7/3/14) TaxID=1108050 RepID=A0A0B7G516_THACB|nr:hypothetical protein RSOLAG1IB_10865 [Rhizoctonia solani AG-1 IB]